MTKLDKSQIWKVQRSDVEASVEHILGKQVYEVLRDWGFELPKIMQLAVEKCFVRRLSGPAVETLREAAKLLSSAGALTNDGEKAKS